MNQNQENAVSSLEALLKVLRKGTDDEIMNMNLVQTLVQRLSSAPSNSVTFRKSSFDMMIPLTTSNAKYWVIHQDGATLRPVDQSVNGGQWVLLGTYRFRGRGGEYVSLADVTHEPYLSTWIAFDAVKWSPR